MVQGRCRHSAPAALTTTIVAAGFGYRVLARDALDRNDTPWAGGFDSTRHTEVFDTGLAGRPPRP